MTTLIQCYTIFKIGKTGLFVAYNHSAVLIDWIFSEGYRVLSSTSTASNQEKEKRKQLKFQIRPQKSSFYLFQRETLFLFFRSASLKSVSTSKNI